MTTDTWTAEGQLRRIAEFVLSYLERRNYSAIARLIGGSPRYDHQDYSDADAGEPPKGAEW